MTLIDAALAYTSPFYGAVMVMKYNRVRRERNILKDSHKQDIAWLNTMANHVYNKDMELDQFGKIVLNRFADQHLQGRR